MKKIIVREEFQIPGTDIVLEKGDQIAVKENYYGHMGSPDELLDTLLQKYPAESILRTIVADFTSGAGMKGSDYQAGMYIELEDLVNGTIPVKR